MADNQHEDVKVSADKPTTSPVASASREQEDETLCSEVTVEYIKENDFKPRNKRGYTPRSGIKPTVPDGAGYYIPGKSGHFVRGMVGPSINTSQTYKREIPKYLRDEWSALLSKGKHVMCGFKECKKWFGSKLIFSHYIHCEGTQGDGNIQCEDCGKELDEEKGVYGHLINCSAKWHKADEEKNILETPQKEKKTTSAKDIQKAESAIVASHEVSESNGKKPRKTNQNRGQSPKPDPSANLTLDKDGDKAVTRGATKDSQQFRLRSSSPCTVTTTSPLPGTTEVVKPNPGRSLELVKNTITSLKNLFGERKRDQTSGAIQSASKGTSYMETRRISVVSAALTPKTQPTSRRARTPIASPSSSTDFVTFTSGMAQTPGKSPKESSNKKKPKDIGSIQDKSSIKSPTALGDQKSTPTGGGNQNAGRAMTVKSKLADKKRTTPDQGMTASPITTRRKPGGPSLKSETGDTGVLASQQKESESMKLAGTTNKIPCEQKDVTIQNLRDVEKKSNQSVDQTATEDKPVDSKVTGNVLSPDIDQNISSSQDGSARHKKGRRGKRGGRAAALKQGMDSKGKPESTSEVTGEVLSDKEPGSDIPSGQGVEEGNQNVTILDVSVAVKDDDDCTSQESLSGTRDSSQLSDTSVKCKQITPCKSQGQGKKALVEPTERKVYPKRNRGNRISGTKAQGLSDLAEPDDTLGQVKNIETSNVEKLPVDDIAVMTEGPDVRTEEDISDVVSKTSGSNVSQTGERKKGDKATDKSTDYATFEGDLNDPETPVLSTKRSRRSVLFKVTSTPKAGQDKCVSQAEVKNYGMTPKTTEKEMSPKQSFEDAEKQLERSAAETLSLLDTGTESESATSPKEIRKRGRPPKRTRAQQNSAKLAKNQSETAPSSSILDDSGDMEVESLSMSTKTPAKQAHSLPPKLSETQPQTPALASAPGDAGDTEVETSKLGDTQAQTLGSGSAHDDIENTEVESTPESTETPAKRKRGRPPKFNKTPTSNHAHDDTGQSELESTMSETPVKRKRGRPPKVKRSQPETLASKSAHDSTGDTTSEPAIHDATQPKTPASSLGKTGLSNLDSDSDPCVTPQTQLQTPASNSAQADSDVASLTFKTPTSVGRRGRKRGAMTQLDASSQSAKRPRLCTDSEEKKTTGTASIQTRRTSGRISVPKRFFDSVGEEEDEEEDDKEVAKDDESDVVEPESDELTENGGNTPAGKGRKRRRGGRGQASRKRRKVEEEDIEKLEEEIDPNETFSCIYCPNEKPMTRRDIKHHMMRRHVRIWSKDDPEGGEYSPGAVLRYLNQIHCPRCDRSFRYVSYYSYHYKWCGKECETVLCEICQRVLRKMYAPQHMRNSHGQRERTPVQNTEDGEEGKKVKRKAAQKARINVKAIISEMDISKKTDKQTNDDDPDAVIEEEEEEEEDQDEYVEEEEKEVVRPPMRKPPIPGQESLQVFEEAMPWTFDWRTKYQNKLVFPDWFPKVDKWTKLTIEESEEYLPQNRLSPWFSSYQKQTQSKPQTRLQRFEVTSDAASAYLNVGGPVWAMAWCPSPLGVKSTQYLAVSCHRVWDKFHSLAQAETEKGNIQLWDCGTLLESHLTETPRIRLVLTHDSGAIWCMKWCPCGAWQEEPNGDGTLPRIGLLAASTSSGYIHIYSIPEPGSLSIEGDDVPVYSVAPVMTLQIQAVGSTDSPTTGCLSFDWQFSDGCRRLVAGFGTGQIAMWDLTTKSDLMQRKCPETGTIFLQPFLVFQGHQAAIKGIAFCQKNPEYFVTGSKDRYVKMWDVKNTDVPINMIQKSEYTQVEWPLHWPTIMAAADDCYHLEHNAVQSMDTGYFGMYVRPMTVHNSCINSLSYSDWLNTFVSVDTAGEVMAIYLPIMLLIYKHHKSFTWRRWLLYSTDLEPLPTCECPTDDSAICGQDSDLGGATSTVPSEGSGLQVSTSSICTCPKCGKPKPLVDSKSESKPNEQTPSSSGSLSIQSTKKSPTVEKKTAKCAKNRGSQKWSIKRDDVEQKSGPSIETMAEMKERFSVVYRDVKISQLNRDRHNKLSFSTQVRPDLINQPPLSANHRVLWNPNLGSHCWIAVGGEAGIVRLVYLSAFRTKKGGMFVQRTFSKTTKEK